MELNLNLLEGQTLIDEKEKEGLLIDAISTKIELDEFEQLNIEDALQWDFILKFKPKYLVTVPSFLLKILDYTEKNGID